jgi:signal peptidase I
MCPTICEQERIVADMHAYRMRNPQRGDLIVLKHEPMSSLLIKRVIGLPGDVVSQTGDTILVNGQALKIAEQSKVCGQPRRETFSASAAIIFEETRITAGAFFVVGDNLPNSFDSRTQAFGVVTQDQIEGRPLFIYWSPGKSRIGCTLS